MLEISQKKGIFKIKSIWFSDYPFDVEDADCVQFFSCKNNVDFVDFSKFEDTTLIIDLTQDLDQIWKNMKKSSCRYAINKALRDGVKIKRNENWEDFIKINQEFRKNKGLSRSYLTVEFVKNNTTLFVAELEGEIIAGQTYLEDKDHIYWDVGASNRLCSSEEKATLIGNANRLLVWEAIKYAKDKGIKEFDLGGYHIDDNSDLDLETSSIFKGRFGGRIVQRYNYKKFYSKTCKLAREGYKTFDKIRRLK